VATGLELGTTSIINNSPWQNLEISKRLAAFDNDFKTYTETTLTMSRYSTDRIS